MKTKHNSPLFPLFLSLGGGIFLSSYLSLTYVWVYSILLLLLSLAGLRMSIGPVQEWFQSILLLLMVLFSGLFLGQNTSTWKNSDELEAFNCRKVEAYGTIIRPVKKGAYGSKTWVVVEGILENERWATASGRIMMYLGKKEDQRLDRFDRIHFEGKMSTLYSSYPSYLKYLKNKGLSHQISTSRIEKIGEARTVAALSYQIQQRLAGRIEALLPDSSQSGLIKAMILGEKNGLDKGIKEDFSRVGISHILAISGMHMGIIFLILDKLLFFMSYLRRGYQLKQLLILLTLLLFMFVSGSSPAVVRASLMFSGILIAKMTFQRHQSLNIVSLTGISQLVISPELAFDLGFQLSYSAVIALILFYPLWENYLSTGLGWRDAILSWIGVTVIATLATSPLIWINFGQFPTYFLLGNVLVSLPVSLLVWLGFLTVIFAYIPFLNASLAWILGHLIDFLLWVIRWVSSLPYAVIEKGNVLFEGIQCLMLEFVLALGLIMILKHFKVSDIFKEAEVPL
ncbi:MAG: ComEC family competence protein [Bacteroidia bacterium]|nr:ComEC family competence protein [Bacteroidia bacterium]